MLQWFKNRVARFRFLIGRTGEVYQELGFLETSRRFVRALWAETRLIVGGTIRRWWKFVVSYLVKLRVIQDYDFLEWRKHNMPRASDLRAMVETLPFLKIQPKFSVIMPVYNPPIEFLRDAIQSVVDQIYTNWELCIADDVSTDPFVRKLLEEFKEKDSRIKVIYRAENGHISRASNTALELATGEFVSLLDHDDLLTPDALYQVVLELNKHPETDMFYSDEDKIDSHGQFFDPYFKQQWCPESFMAHMMIGHLTTYRKRLVDEVGAFRPAFDGSQDYDLALRITEKTNNIRRIPKILYHWRAHRGSASASTLAKPYAYEAAVKALSEALERRKQPGVVKMIDGAPSTYRIRYKRPSDPLVSIIIPTRDQPVVLERCLASIFSKSTYRNIEVLVVDNGSKLDDTKNVFAKWQSVEPERFRVMPLDIPFNFSRINNEGVKEAKGDILLFLNDDTEVVTPDWIEAMLEFAQNPAIGAVGAKLLYPDGKVQHAGIVLGTGNNFVLALYRGTTNHSVGYARTLITAVNYTAVTGACLMCRREAFEKIGGFDEDLAVAFNDVDLCLKLIDAGYRNVWVAYAVLNHFESKSRGSDTTPEKRKRLYAEIDRLRARWKEYCADDPTYNPNLSINPPGYAIKRPERRWRRKIV